MSISLTPARAAASRKNGAKSQGPKTPEGKARSARNALKHGLCAESHLVSIEDEQEYEALEAALFGELAPVGVLQALLVRRIVRAAWRLERAERIEAEVLEFRLYDEADLGLALTRDCNSARAFDTLRRYRGSALAEFFRALRTLQALQAEARAEVRDAVPAHAGAAVTGQAAAERSSSQQRNDPDTRRNPGESALHPASAQVAPVAPPVLASAASSALTAAGLSGALATALARDAMVARADETNPKPAQTLAIRNAIG